MTMIYTDGCCNRQGVGGYAAIIKTKDNVLLLGGYAVKTTNNQMELLGPIVALGSIETECEVTLFSDSKYFVDGFNTGMHKWQQLGWCLNRDRPAKNIEFWKSMFHLNGLFSCKAHWIKGHSGHILNDICDYVAKLCQENEITININYPSLKELLNNYEGNLRTA